MELQLELELEWELKWKLAWEMELQPHKPENYSWPPPKNPDLRPKRRFEAPDAIPRDAFWGFWSHFSKMEKWTFAPGDQLYNTRFPFLI